MSVGAPSKAAANRPRRRRRWIWWLVILVIVVGGFAWLRGRGRGPKAVDQSLIVKVKRGDLQIDVIETGKVQPREKVEIKSKVAGQAEKVFVKEGEMVKKGQLLLRLDPTDFRRDVAKAEAELASARNALEYAQLNLDRKRRGLEGRATSQAEVDLAQNEVKARQATIASISVTLGAAQDRLRYTEILSPLGGTVIQRGIEPGEVVTPGVQATFEGKALLTVADLSTLIVRAELNQIDVAKVKLGQNVDLSLDALPGRTYHARITKIAPASTTPKGKDVDVFPVEATLTDGDVAIKPGMTADVRVHIETRPKVLLLPIEAVVKERDKEKDKDRFYVTKVTRTGQQGPAALKTDKMEVQVGARNDREQEITGGVTEGMEVLIQPASAAENEVKM